MMSENRSLTTAESRPEYQPKRIFRSTLDALKSALKGSASVSAAPPPPQVVQPQPRKENIEYNNTRLHDIQTRIDQLPEARFLREPHHPVPFFETAHGIEKLSPTLPEVLVSEKIAQSRPQMIPSNQEETEEKFEDTSERFENEKQKMNENLEELAPSVTQKRDLEYVPTVEIEDADAQPEEQSDESKESSEGESDLDYKEFEPQETKKEPFPTMEQERESAVEEEARWVKEHHMEPDEGLTPPATSEQD